MFAWLFHRVSGLALIALIGMQMTTALLMLSKKNAALAEAARKLHTNSLCVTLIAGLFILHAMYGLRTILYEAGVRKEKLLFWVCTAVGVVLSAAYVWAFLALKAGA